MIKAACLLVVLLLAAGCQSQAIITCSGLSSLFTLQSVVINGYNTDTTSLVLETRSSGMSMTIQYAGTGFGSVSTFQGAVNFDRIVEFTDTGAPGYDGETIVKTTPLNFEFDPPNSCSSVETVMNFTHIDTNTTKPLLTLQCYVVKAQRSIGSVEIIPTQTKCDVIIENYPYESNANHIALAGGYWYQSASIFAGSGGPFVSTNVVSVAVNGGSQSIALDWVSTAATNQGTANVIFTQHDGSSSTELSGFFDSSETLFFTFSEAGSPFINWDPSFGLVQGSSPTNTPKSSGTNKHFASIVILAVALVALF